MEAVVSDIIKSRMQEPGGFKQTALVSLLVHATAIGVIVAMPGATTSRLVEPEAPMPWKAPMIPNTVPNNPIKGVTAAAVARNVMRRSSLFTSTLEARSSARSTAASDFNMGRTGGDGAGCATPVACRSCRFSSA